MSKWVYAISVIVIALVVSVSNCSEDRTGTEAPKTPTFDIQGYYNKHKDYYGDISLDEVARDAFMVGEFNKEYPDYNTWKKAVGIEPLIQEDLKRRTPPPSFLDKVMGAIPFRYDEESIQGRLYRYDRFTKTVQLRLGSNEDFRWVPIPGFKNLQHARDVLTKMAIDRQNEESRRNDMLRNLETERQNEELKRSIGEVKSTVEAAKREQEFRDMRKK